MKTGTVNRKGFRLEPLTEAEKLQHPGCRWVLFDHGRRPGVVGHSVKAERLWYFGTKQHAEIHAAVFGKGR